MLPNTNSEKFHDSAEARHPSSNEINVRKYRMRDFIVAQSPWSGYTRQHCRVPKDALSGTGFEKTQWKKSVKAEANTLRDRPGMGCNRVRKVQREQQRTEA